MLEKQAAEGRTPEALRRRPQLDSRQVGYFNAYQQVAGSRRVGMGGPLPIPVSEVRAYFELYKIHDVEIIETIHDRINFLDGVYLEHVAKQAKSKK